jgi:glycosyltransferase involved in cell wall biosynthesis
LERIADLPSRIEATPRVSVIVIFRDADRFLPKAVESVFLQSLTDWELLLVDDGSTDRSTALARALAAEHRGRVSYLEHPCHANLGMSATRNLGVARASAPYVAFLDADDVWLPAKLDDQVRILEKTGAGLTYGRILIWHGWTGRPEDAARDRFEDLGVVPDVLVDPPHLFPQLLENRHQSPTTSGSLLRRDVIEHVGGFETQFRGMYEDQAFFAKVLLSTRTYVSGRCWARYRQHPESHSAQFERHVRYHTGRQAFLTWLEQYLNGQTTRDPQAQRVVRRELFAARHHGLRPLARLRPRRRSIATVARSGSQVGSVDAPVMSGAADGSCALVSVITPFLDAGDFLADAIESVVAQTHAAWELLLVDDGSTDGSEDIARDYVRRHPGRIRIFRHAGGRNRGKSVSRNLAIAEAQGKYLAFLDADDVFLSGKLARQVRLLEARPEAAMVYGPTLYWYGWTGEPGDRARDRVAPVGVAVGRLHPPPTLLTAYLRNGGVVPCTCGLLVRTSVLRWLGGFETSIEDLFEDQVVLAKICLASPVYVDGVCADLYRQHARSTSAAAVLTGRYHPVRPNPAHAAYLGWLSHHIAGSEVRDRDLRRALDGATFAYRHPRLASVRRFRRRRVTTP